MKRSERYISESASMLFPRVVCTRTHPWFGSSKLAIAFGIRFVVVVVVAVAAVAAAATIIAACS